MSSVVWRAHLAAGLLVLVAISAYVGYDGYFFIDEAAVYAEVEVRDAGDWTVDRPLAEFDTDGAHVPMALSTIVGDDYAPFGKHPLHVEILHLADEVGGRLGVRAVSTFGVWVASVAAALLTRRGNRQISVIVFWLSLLASPLVFQAQLVVAHALAAGVSGLAFVSADRLRGLRRVVAVAGLLTFACLLRSEAVLLAGAFGVVLAVRGLRRRRAEDLILGASAVLAGLGAYLLEPLLVESTIGADAAPQVIAASSQGGLDGRLSATGSALLAAASGGYGDRSAVLVLLTGIFGVGAAVFAYRRPGEPALALVLGSSAVVSGALFVRYPATVPGLLWSFPFLLAGGALWAGGLRDWRRWGRQPTWALPVAGVFAASVLAVQYDVAGGFEWGWRYFAVALPLITPSIGAMVYSLWTGSVSAMNRLVWALVAVAFVLVPLGGLREQRRVLDDTAYLLHRIDEIMSTSDADWIVSLHPSFGRFAHGQSLEGNVLSTTKEDSGRLLDELADRRADAILVVWRGDPEPPIFDPGPFTTVLGQVYIASEFRAELRSA